MIRALFLAVVLSLGSVGCGPADEPSASAASSTVDLASLPVTLEGMLLADVAEGDTDEDGGEGEYSEFNFGSLTVGSEEIPVQVSGNVLRSAGLSQAEGRVRATLGSKSDEYGHTYYQITKLDRL